MDEIKLLPPVAVVRVRAGCTPVTDAEAIELNELCDRYGMTALAEAAGTSIQSIAKAIARKPLFESTKSRLRTVLRR